MTHEIITVYRGDSINRSNGSQPDMPIVGRFAAIVNVDCFRLVEDDDSGEWYIAMPFGSTLGSDGTEMVTRMRWEDIQQSLAFGRRNGDGWTTDKEIARQDAIDSATARHNQHAATSPAYVKQFGEPVLS